MLLPSLGPFFDASGFVELTHCSLGVRSILLFSLLSEVIFEKLEVFDVNIFDSLFFNADAEIPHACQQRGHRFDVFLNRGGRQCFDESPLLGNLAFLAVLGERHFLLQFSAEISLEAGDPLGSAFRVTAAAFFELAVLGWAAIANAIVVGIRAHWSAPSGRSAVV